MFDVYLPELVIKSIYELAPNLALRISVHGGDEAAKVETTYNVHKLADGSASLQITGQEQSTGTQTDFTETHKRKYDSDDIFAVPEFQVKKGRGRPRKEAQTSESNNQDKVSRGRGRPRKEQSSPDDKPQIKRGPGRPKKDEQSVESPRIKDIDQDFFSNLDESTSQDGFRRSSRSRKPSAKVLDSVPNCKFCAERFTSGKEALGHLYMSHKDEPPADLRRGIDEICLRTGLTPNALQEEEEAPGTDNPGSNQTEQTTDEEIKTIPLTLPTKLQYLASVTFIPEHTKQCPLCCLWYPNPREILSHLEVKHANDVNKEEAVGKIKETYGYPCDMCMAWLHSKEDLEKHVDVIHTVTREELSRQGHLLVLDSLGTDEIPGSLQVSEYQCKMCLNRLDDWLSLSQHIIAEHGPEMSQAPAPPDTQETSQDTPINNQDTPNSNQEVHGTIQELSGTNQEVLGTNQEVLGTNQEVLGTNQEVVGTNQEVIGTNQKVSSSVSVVVVQEATEDISANKDTPINNDDTPCTTDDTPVTNKDTPDHSQRIILSTDALNLIKQEVEKCMQQPLWDLDPMSQYSHCLFCNVCYEKRTDLYTHMQVNHKKHPMYKSLIEEAMNTDDMKLLDRLGYSRRPRNWAPGDSLNLSCKLCRKTGIKSYVVLRTHVKRRHKKSAKKKEYLMEIREFSKVQCIDCGKFYSGRHELMMHRKNVHTLISPEEAIQKTQTCPICFNIYKNKHCLKGHMASVHSKIKHVCDICGGTFKNKSILTSHVNYVHLKNMIETCKVCGKRIPKRRMKMHLETHTNNFRFYCEHCHKGFHEKANCHRHVRLVHDRNQLTYLKCDQCPKQFTTISNLRQHRQTVHGQGVFKCGYCQETLLSRSKMRNHIQRVHATEIVNSSDLDKMETNIPMVQSQVVSDQTTAAITLAALQEAVGANNVHVDNMDGVDVGGLHQLEIEGTEGGKTIVYCTTDGSIETQVPVPAPVEQELISHPVLGDTLEGEESGQFETIVMQNPDTGEELVEQAVYYVVANGEGGQEFVQVQDGSVDMVQKQDIVE
ncbi:unnamed protein product [Owenia fusiformis]|uniref:Uncharacterized protein n=1 Tax=Owenia fusiformis TaxID=6347 RepID=A0A8J1TW78_OWEFU|nr:unnamed protein product [Owenia fusiformis]